MKRAFVMSVLLGTALFWSSPFRAQEEKGKPEGGLAVAECKLGTGVEDRQIVGEDSTFSVNSKVYLWMKLTGGPADSVSVTWKHGDSSYETRLRVGGSPWRTWTYKTVSAAGAWTVTVTDATGSVLKEVTFTVTGEKP